MRKTLRSLLSFALRLIQKSEVIMGLWKSFCSNAGNAFWWSLASLVGGLMPLWTAMFLRRLHNQPIGIRDFAQRGDFALYSAAFLAPVIYQVAASVRRETSFLRTGAMTMSATMLAFSAIVFTAVNPDLITSHTADGAVTSGPLNMSFLLKISWMLLIFGFAMAFAVFLNESYQENPNIDSAGKIDIGVMDKQFTLKDPVKVATENTTVEPQLSEELIQEDLGGKFKGDIDVQ